MKPGGMKALVLGMGPKDEEATDDKPDEAKDSEGLSAAGQDLLDAIKSGDAAAVGRALQDAHDICSGSGGPETDEE